jgi:hypothetical protein
MPRHPMSRTGHGSAVALLLILGMGAAQAQVLGPAPPPDQSGPGRSTEGANLRTALDELKLRPIGPVERSGRHLATDAVMEDGRLVAVTFDRSGQLLEIELRDFEPSRSATPIGDPAPVLERVRNAGFGNPVMSELRRRHAVVRATTQKNEPVELHIDNAGVIFRQTWLRGEPMEQRRRE